MHSTLHRPSSLRTRLRPGPRGQRGMTVFGMVFVALVVGFVALMAIRAFPAVNEYWTIKRAIAKIMKDNPQSAEEVRRAYNKQAEVEYSISTLSATDLEITTVNGALRCRYRYNKEIEILDPLYLLLTFDGSASTNNSGP